ncbi:amino acid ABC transporter ATP-binding protein [Streptosporangium sp. NPDC004631]
MTESPTTERDDQGPTATAPMVTAEGVHKFYGDHHVLKGVDLEVERQEVMCIIGPSGSGKSTFLRCVNRLETITAGRIRVGGELIGYREKNGRLYDMRAKEIARQRRRMGMVFQSFNLFPNMTALGNVMEAPVRVKKMARARAEEIARSSLAQVGLADKADAYPSQLSGGQQQRVAIARALTMNPEVMLFDEPTSALDPELVGEVLDVIRSLASSGMTMIVVTHEISFARDVADQLVFMDAGLVVERGDPRELLSNPRHARTRQFLAAAGTP